MILRRVVEIPSRKIIEDIALKNGCPQDIPNCEKYSPYYGIRDEIMKYDKALTLKEFLAQKDTHDFNPDVMKPTSGGYTNYDGEKPGMYYLRKLEEIEVSWVRKYLDNLLYRKRAQKSGDRKHNDDLRMSTAFNSMGEDGERLQESEIEKSAYIHPDIFKEIYSERITHILKRMDELSCEYKVHIVSLIIAYERALYNSPVRIVSNSDVLTYNVLKYDRGVIREPITKNKGIFQEYLFNWISGRVPTDMYYQEAMELVRICTEIGVDLKKEDPKVYTSEFVRSLTTTYILSNKDYMISKSRKINMQVLNTLKNLTIDDYLAISKDEEMYQEESKWDIAKSYEFIESHEELDVMDENAIRVFQLWYNKAYGTNYNFRKMETLSGFYYESYDKPLMLDVSKFYKNDFSAYSKAMLHCSGILIEISKTDKIEYITSQDAVNYIKDRLSGIDIAKKKYTGNRNFGKWQVERWN